MVSFLSLARGRERQEKSSFFLRLVLNALTFASCFSHLLGRRNQSCIEKHLTSIQRRPSQFRIADHNNRAE